MITIFPSVKPKVKIDTVSKNDSETETLIKKNEDDVFSPFDICMNVPIYGTYENPVFMISDICRMIEIDNNSKYVKQVENDDEFRGTVGHNFKHRGQETRLVNEHGVYEILSNNGSVIAREFRIKLSKLLRDLRINRIKMIEAKQHENEVKTKEILDGKNEEIKDKSQIILSQANKLK